MATLLYKLGRFSYRRRKLVAAAWGLILVIIAAGAFSLGGSTTDEFSIPGTESQQALDALKTELPAASGISGLVVVQAPEGKTLTDPAVAAELTKTVETVAGLPEVAQAVGPVESKAISPDGRTGLISVAYSEQIAGLSDEAIEGFENVGETADSSVLTVVSNGALSEEAPAASVAEVIGVAIAAVVLVITFGSMVAAGMTLLTALFGVAVGMIGLIGATAFFDISSTAPILALMLGLAVGIDYALFISSRHRNNLAEGLDPEESIGRATGTAGSAVLFAGLTVVIALSGLAVVGIPFLTAMGLAAAGTVLTAVVVALTLLPAMLGFVGTRILPRKVRKRAASGEAAAEPEDTDTHGFRWGRFVTKNRVAVVVIGVLALGALSLPVAGMKLAMPDKGTAPEGSNSRVAYDITSEAFGAGSNGPLMVVISADTPGEAGALLNQANTAISQLDGVVAVQPGSANESGTVRLLTATPETGPTSPETSKLVEQIRDTVSPLQAGGSTISVSGMTAVGVDVSAKLGGALPIYLIVVVGLSFVLLTLAFRSLLVPLKATLGFLLTIGATFGLTVAVFQWGWGAELFGVDTPAPLVSFLPMIMMAILFGLAMDYEVFIVSRVREEFVHGSHATEATITGLGHGARVVTAAALIMASVFGGFMFMHDPIIKTIGFGLTVGVLIDAFIVRMTIVPAVLSLMGDRAWSFPRWLDKITPRVDIEGENLRVETAKPEDRRDPDEDLVKV